MDAMTAEIVDAATQRFYRLCAASFSDTRQSAWPGWNRVLDAFVQNGRASAHGGSGPRGPQAAGSKTTVLDLGCGNLRFERFLASSLPGAELEFFAVDRCIELAPDVPDGVTFIEADVTKGLDALSGVPQCDLAVSFALLHHIPQPETRLEIVKSLMEKMRPGALACISFWQFAKDERLLKGAMEATGKGCRELGISLDATAGDYLLGWQGMEGVYRFCHSFTDGEVDALVSDCNGRVVDDFYADGASGDLNKYVVLSKD